ncbi:MAG: exo-alpha-sialidase [Bacteroidales bacterium]|nr:exo-alpha-sialidase [Bacteroidales bacterium]
MPEHVIVYHQEGRFAGWPANNGVWKFGENEILVGFTEAEYKLGDGHNATEPYRSWLAKSEDGGQTWTTWDPENYVGDFGDLPELKNLVEPIHFENEGFAMRIVGIAYHGCEDPRAHFFYSYDKGASWKGPFGFGDLVNHPELKKYGLNELTPRTDYLVTGQNECLVFMAERKLGSFGSDRLFCIKTEDGGKTFSFQGWVVKPFLEEEKNETFKVELTDDPEKNPYATECRAVMSQSVILKNGDIVTTMRRKYNQNDLKEKNWIDAYISSDLGKTWKFLSRVGDTGEGNGNPPAIAVTSDNRLCVIYGERTNGTMQAVYSSDNGKNWSEPQVIMDGFWSEDMELNDLGYPRLVALGDGKLVAIYYYSTKELLHHLRATSWKP